MLQRSSKKKSFRYGPFTIAIKKAYRKIFPVSHTTYNPRPIEDICAKNFVAPGILHSYFKNEAIPRLKESRGDAIGDYLEFGVYNGNSLASMYLAAKEKGITGTRFFGFDAFEGLPPDSEGDDGGVWRKGFYKCTFEQMLVCLAKRGVDPKNITWVKGWYNETLTPAIVEKHSLADPGIIFVDCDTYNSSKAVLDFVTPLIKKEVIVCLDDWKLNDLDIKGMGEYRAFNEFLEANPRFIASEIPSYNRESRCFLVRPGGDQ